MRIFLPISIVFHILLFLYIGKNTDVKPHLHTIEVDVRKRVSPPKVFKEKKTQTKKTQRKSVKVKQTRKKQHYWNSQRKPDYLEVGEIKRERRLLKHNFPRHITEPKLFKPGKSPGNRRYIPHNFSEAVQVKRKQRLVKYNLPEHNSVSSLFKAEKIASRQKYILRNRAKAGPKKYRLAKQDAPINANNIRKNDKSTGFRQLVLVSIEKNKKYPLTARRRGIEGSVLIKFLIKEDGSVSDVKIIESSGHSILDKSAVKGVFAAAPFPSPPTVKDGFWFKFRLSFALT